MPTRDDFNMLRCRDDESDSCDSLLWDAYARGKGRLSDAAGVDLRSSFPDVAARFGRDDFSRGARLASDTVPAASVVAAAPTRG